MQEQKAIAQFLDKKTRSIRKLTSALNQQVKKIHEYQESLKSSAFGKVVPRAGDI
jgi:restriction endonuclease S subunit